MPTGLAGRGAWAQKNIIGGELKFSYQIPQGGLWLTLHWKLSWSDIAFTSYINHVYYIYITGHILHLYHI